VGEEARYFEEWFHREHQMGALEMAPGKEVNPAVQKVIRDFMLMGAGSLER
jgi:hypothetical protein